MEGVALCAVVGTPERIIPYRCARLYASLNELVGQGFGRGVRSLFIGSHEGPVGFVTGSSV